MELVVEQLLILKDAPLDADDEHLRRLAHEFEISRARGADRSQSGD